jgi:aryl-alcohol dehydrogenase-like predicted oxidoreductase
MQENFTTRSPDMGDIPDSTKFLHEAELGLGAWAWGDKIVWNYGKGYSDADIEEGFRVSLENGVSLVDTAEVYGNGRSERLLGQFLKNTETPVIVATKFFPMPWRWTKGSVARALKGSLNRLDLEQVDLYQVHWPSPLIPVETYAEGLAEVHKAGWARAVGVSNYNKNQMQRAVTVLSKYAIPLASNQVEYHLLNRSVEKNGLLARCQELGIRLIAYSPLAMGLLTGKYSPENPPPGVRGGRYNKRLSQIQPLIKLMTEIGQDIGGKSPAQVALNWLICKGAMPIPGAKNTSQAEMNAAAAGWRLSQEQVAALDEVSDGLTK